MSVHYTEAISVSSTLCNAFDGNNGKRVGWKSNSRSPADKANAPTYRQY